VFLQFPPGPLAVFSQVPSEQQHWLLLVQHLPLAPGLQQNWLTVQKSWVVVLQ
jgi:hypothetical protein